MFKSMMAPVVSGVGSVAKTALPPLGGLSAGLDVAELFHEYGKPQSQRDYTKMLLKGAGALGGGLSMIPGGAPIGVPLAVGSSAIQAYREDPEILERIRRRLADMPPTEDQNLGVSP